MKYRVHVRSYIDYCRPLEWRSVGQYDIDDAIALAQRFRVTSHDDVWLVPA